ncbi:hypothetical protein E8L99_20275 [Phreatobacter aquaticus]|uniref:Uncharacterized protein n=1 Tax=Phreatobacter aquaticus TaxID=2570229 RepID=A0A4D7QVB5_9HYPH|nr:hypothetical protein [Phreatobacter aquaticus]QCK87922.1 hypothetical protein E8L99_20275 [Phreatobacter aquaticus]
MRLRIIIAAAAGLFAFADLAAAQTAPAASTRSRSTTAAPATGTPAATTTTRRARSPAQLRNDQIMRACGAEWRAGKTALQAAGKTWRTFLPECRARRVRT